VDLAPFDENANPANDACAIVEELRKYDEACSTSHAGWF